MTVAEIIDSINANIRSIYPDKGFLDSVVLKDLNRVLREIAGVYHLPDLQKTRTITFEAYEDDVTGYEAKVSLPSDFGHSIYWARNLTQESDITRIYPNVAALKSEYSGSNPTGSVEAIAWDGASIWGFYCPETEEEVSISYYKNPDTLTLTSTPDCLPVRLHEGLLADGTTARLLKRIPEEIKAKAGGVNMKYHLEEARVALGDLESICRLSPRTKPFYRRDVQYF